MPSFYLVFSGFLLSPASLVACRLAPRTRGPKTQDAKPSSLNSIGLQISQSYTQGILLLLLRACSGHAERFCVLSPRFWPFTVLVISTLIIFGDPSEVFAAGKRRKAERCGKRYLLWPSACRSHCAAFAGGRLTAPIYRGRAGLSQPAQVALGVKLEALTHVRGGMCRDV